MYFFKQEYLPSPGVKLDSKFREKLQPRREKRKRAIITFFIQFLRKIAIMNTIDIKLKN